MKINIELKTIFKIPESPLKATATVVLDDAFIIRNVKLIENENGMFMSMPTYRGRDGKWHSVCHPTTSEFRIKMQDALIDAYRQG